METKATPRVLFKQGVGDEVSVGEKVQGLIKLFFQLVFIFLHNVFLNTLLRDRYTIFHLLELSTTSTSRLCISQCEYINYSRGFVSSTLQPALYSIAGDNTTLSSRFYTTIYGNYQALNAYDYKTTICTVQQWWWLNVKIPSSLITLQFLFLLYKLRSNVAQ